MKTFKKICSLFLCVLLVTVLFSSCSSSDKVTSEITDDTLIFAYTEENPPFLYTDEEGNMAGFEVDLINATFDSFKGDYSDYAFVKVDEGYVLDEDICYTDNEGNEYSALIYCGGFTKNTGTADEDYDWSSNILENDVVTIVPVGSDIESYSNVVNHKAAVLSGAALTALDKNTAVENSLKSYDVYDNADDAFNALDSGDADMLIIDEFSLYAYEGYTTENYTVLSGILDSTEYAFAFSRSEDYASSFNEAVKEMLSPDYNDGDTLTPLVEEYFGDSSLCIFDYE